MKLLTAKYPQEIRRILDKYPDGEKQSALMPLLYLAQRESGHISREAMEEIASILDISVTDVSSVAGFYSLFHEEAGGRYRIQVCTDLPCALRGSEQFLHGICDYLGINSGETSSDGIFTVEEVKCLASCHHAPVLQVQGDGDISYHMDMTLETAQKLVDSLRVEAQKGGKE